MSEPASRQAVIRACLDGVAATQTLSPRQWQVCHHVLDCRTAALGGFALRCDQCGQEALCYHACRDRHCPRCQRRARRLPEIRDAIAAAVTTTSAHTKEVHAASAPTFDGYPCSTCRTGRLRVRATLGPKRRDGG